MGLPEYTDVLRRRWRSVLALCVLGALVAVAVSMLGVQRSASTTLILSTADGDGAVAGSELAEERLASWAELATSPRVAAAVTDDLGDDLADGDSRGVARDLSAATVPGSFLLVVTARDRVPEVATAKATSAGEQLVALVDELSPGGPGLVVAQPAALAPPPGTGDAVTTALLGAALGLAAGVAAALARDGSDRRVRAAPALPGPDGSRGSATTGTTVLGELPVSARQLRRYATSMPLEGSLAEGFRRLRASLLTQGRAQRTVLVTSSQPGEGATEVARGLAVTLARGGLRVALVDAHLRGGRARSAEPDAPDGLVAALRGEVAAHEALVDDDEPGVAVLRGGGPSAEAGELATSPAMAKLVASLHDGADVVVVDVPAVLPFADAPALCAMVGGDAVLVARAGVTRQRDAEAALDQLSRAQPSSLGVVLLRDGARRHERAR